MRSTGIGFVLAVWVAAAFLLCLAGLNFWNFVRGAGEIPPQFHLIAAAVFGLAGAGIAWAGWVLRR